MRKIFIALLIAAAITAGCDTAPWQDRIEAGQIWVYEYKTPFTHDYIEYKVLAVKDGYVQYTRDGWVNPSSSSIGMFRVVSHLKTVL